MRDGVFIRNSSDSVLQDSFTLKHPRELHKLRLQSFNQATIRLQLAFIHSHMMTGDRTRDIPSCWTVSLRQPLKDISWSLAEVSSPAHHGSSHHIIIIIIIYHSLVMAFLYCYRLSC